MSQITINTISGSPPYNIYVCDISQLNCVLTLSGVASVPPAVTFTIPSAFTNSPSVLIKIIDSTLCEYTSTYTCILPTPTPTITSTQSLTPTNTPTPNVTPSNTQTQFTPTPSLTNTSTPSNTPTISITPSVTSEPQILAWLLIEPKSGSTSIGSWLYNNGSEFLGFTNYTIPSNNQSTFNDQLNKYLNYSGWSSGEFIRIPLFFPSLVLTSQDDALGNRNFLNQFTTTQILNGLVNGDAWYSFLIYTGLTNGLFVKQIDLSYGDQNNFDSIKTNPEIYNLTITYTGYNFSRITYRLYTTFPSPVFYLNNTNMTFYFKGSLMGT